MLYAVMSGLILCWTICSIAQVGGSAIHALLALAMAIVVCSVFTSPAPGSSKEQSSNLSRI